MSSRQSSSLQTINELIAGSFGGAAQVLVGQPLDTIKTRAQIAPSACRDAFVFFKSTLANISLLQYDMMCDVRGSTYQRACS